MLKIKNGKVRCVGYNDSEGYFTIGKIYNVIDNTIVDDTGFKYNHFNMESEKTITEWLSTWYKFELVSEDKIVIIHDGKTTTATLYHGDEKIAATARCAPEDKFNFMVGANLAMERLNNEINKLNRCDCPTSAWDKYFASPIKKKTNADRIRSMNDEELAEIIACPKGLFDRMECFYYSRNCEDCILEWLKQPAEEG